MSQIWYEQIDDSYMERKKDAIDEVGKRKRRRPRNTALTEGGGSAELRHQRKKNRVVKKGQHKGSE